MTASSFRQTFALAATIAVLTAGPIDCQLFADGPDTNAIELAKGLASVELDQRRDAAYALAKLGPDSLPAVEALIQGLEDRDEQVWMQSAMAIARIGPGATQAIDGLIEHFASRSDQRRYRAAWAVGKIGRAAIERLQVATEDDSQTKRLTAYTALGWMTEDADAVLPILRAAVDSDDAQTRRQAAESLVRLGNVATDAIADSLSSSDEEVLMVIANGLSTLDRVPTSVESRLIELTTHENENIHAAAILALAASQVEADRLVDLLASGAVHKSASVRNSSVLAMRKLGEAATRVTPRLIEALDVSDEDTRAFAAFALGSMGPLASPAIGPMIAAMKRQTVERADFTQAISRIGAAAVPALLAAAADPEQSPQRLATALAGIGPTATQPLIEALNGPANRGPANGSSTSEVSDDNAMNNLVARASAASAIAEMQPPPQSALEPLAACLDEPSEQLRAAATTALGRLPKINDDVLAGLRDLVSDPAASVRRAAVTAVAAQDKDASTVAKLLMTAMSDEDASVRARAIDTLSTIGDQAKEALSSLSIALDDSDVSVRQSAAIALGDLGQESKAVIPKLISLTTDNHAAAREAAVTAIGKIGDSSPDAVNALTGLLSDSEQNVRLAALLSLAKVKADAESCLGAVTELMADPSIEIRSAAILCLASIQREPTESVPLLMTGLNDEDWTVRRTAAESLGKIGNAAVDAVPVLFRMLESDDDSDAARGALRAIDNANADAVPVLIEGLESGDRRRGYYAMFLLGKVGPDAREALPILKRLRDETDSDRYKDSYQRTIDQIEVDQEAEAKDDNDKSS